MEFTLFLIMTFKKLMTAVQRVLEKVAADPQHAQPVDSKDHENFGIGQVNATSSIK